MVKRPSFFHHLHPPTIPARESRFRYTFGLGGISLLLVIILGLTGALELFYYIPSLGEANRSLQLINLFVPYGQLVRSLHYWAGQALLVTTILHMLRVLLTGAYKHPRRFNWLLGLSLLVMILFFNFTGYALRWDEDIAWALMVGTNLLKNIPWIGDGLYGMVVGGSEIGSLTIVRLFGWHVYGLSLIAFFVLVWHLFRVRRDGGISRVLPQGKASPNISRDELVRRELLAALFASIVLLALAALFPPGLASSADFSQLPTRPVAPWFFIWMQQLLRIGQPFHMGVLIPGGLLLILALLPFTHDRHPQGVGLWFNAEGRFAQAAGLFVVLLISFLSLWGLLG